MTGSGRLESPHENKTPNAFFLSQKLSNPTASLSLQRQSIHRHHHHHLSMEIPEKLLKFKYHLLAGLVFGVAVVFLVLLAPRFLTLFAYFWPLFLSTALFLTLVLLFGKTSPVSSGAADTTGKGLLDYVAGPPEPPLDPHAA